MKDHFEIENIAIVNDENSFENINDKTSPTGKLIFSLEDYNLDILAHKTGITRGRLQRLTKLGIDLIETYELALIEMAADKETGELFKALFKGVKLS